MMSKHASPTQTLAVISLVFLTSTCLTLYMMIIQGELLLDGAPPGGVVGDVVPIRSPLLKIDGEQNKSEYADNTEVLKRLQQNNIEEHHDELRSSNLKSFLQVGRRTQSLYLNIAPDDTVDYVVTNQSPRGLDVYKSAFVLNYKSLSGHIWPEDNPTQDRILEQLQYKSNSSSRAKKHSLKTILLHSTFDDVVTGQSVFRECPRRHCTLTRTNDHMEMSVADAVLLGHSVSQPYPTSMRKPQQIWIYHNLESPMHPDIFEKSKPIIFNWTATYRSDSTIVTPYEKFVIFPNVTKVPTEPLQDYSNGKTSQVAWFVSNCNNHNGRLSYARELSLYISVHIYGNCGDRRCSRNTEEQCFHMLRRKYKFYLAFESANCRDYITEKFFRNALMNDVIPIAMGAPRSDYEKVAPTESFIHVDDFSSPKHLAEYLHVLDKDDIQYNKYFRWKSMGTFINTHFFCRLCAMLHTSPQHVTWYNDLKEWWTKDMCIKTQLWASWKK